MAGRGASAASGPGWLRQRVAAWGSAHPSVRSPELRRQVRLLEAIAAVFLVLVVAGTFAIPPLVTGLPYTEDPLVPAGLLGIALITGAMVLSRGPHPRAGLALFVLGGNAVIWIDIHLTRSTAYHDGLLAFPALSVATAALLWSPRAVVALAAANVALLVAAAVADPAGAGVSFVVAVGLLILAGILATSAWLRRQDMAQIEGRNAELRASEDRLRLLTEASQEGIVVHEDGRLIEANRAIGDMLGYTREEILGMHILDPVAPESRADAIRAMTGGKDVTYDAVVVKKDGTRLEVEIHAQPFPLPGRKARVVVVRDVSTYRKAQRESDEARKAAEAANRAKSEFLATMSHEIRTPLNAVLGVADLLRGSGLPAELEELLREQRNAGEHLLGLVSDILDFSRIEAGQMRLLPEPVDVAGVVRDAAGAFRARALEQGLELVVDVPGPTWVVTDGARLRQVVLNLVSNAVKFTQRGHVRVSAKVEPKRPLAGDALNATAGGPHRSPPGGPVAGDGEAGATAGAGAAADDRPAGILDVTIRIEDSGPGMDAEEMRRLFQPFYQVDGSMRRVHGGAGLGLAISQRLARLLGGGIVVESRTGAGSSFTVRLTLPRGEAPAVRATEPVPGAAIAPLRILLAEDNAVNRKVALKLLAKLGQAADIAVDGQDAVEKAREHRYDLIFMDIHMPRLDGLEAARRLREAGECARIVALTADALVGDREKCLAAGMDGYLAKPVRLEDLEGELRATATREEPRVL